MSEPNETTPRSFIPPIAAEFMAKHGIPLSQWPEGLRSNVAYINHVLDNTRPSVPRPQAPEGEKEHGR